ncbi:oligosaccharide flippase family protein [Acinetobacter towneri]|uniref:oligosaccharide flippase family protein n=1 Tax=Acinetobacter towneri TaxID=202956 RepID=UPI00209822B3|nr:oligosaccharide flippase family protein [Acinetobacter towneri]MCO8058840.1 oligosaccharide flippase family protein [Acinetobacter towneri]MCO8064684.1 oligosaccharide flippase family protein [Acinetobacter towneri]
MAIPVITRLYSQDDIGKMSIFFSILLIVSSIGMLRYELVVTICEKTEFNRIVNLCLSILLINTIIVILLVVFFNYFFKSYSILGGLIYLLPVGLFVFGVFSLFNNILMFDKNYNLLAKIKINQVVLSLLLQMSFFKIGVIALIMSQIISYGIIGVKGAFSKIKIDLGVLKYRDEFLKYKKYLIYSTPGALFNSLGGQFPAILIGILFGVIYAGFYGLAQKLVFTPLIMITNNLSNIFFSESKRMIEDKTISEKLGSFFKITTIIALPLLIIIYFSIEYIVAIALGEQWVDVGKIIKYMLFWVFFFVLGAPVSILYEVVGMQKVGLIFQFVLFLCRIMSIIYSYYVNDFFLGIMVFSLLSGLCWLGLILWIVLYFKVNLFSNPN